MMTIPKVSSAIQKKYTGQTAIALDGEIVAIGKNSVLALEKAKNSIPNIEEKDFLIFRIHDPKTPFVPYIL